MRSHRKFTSGFSYLFILLLSVSSHLHGQDKQRFTGSLRLGAYEGEADYQYDLIRRDTILDGAFRMQSSSLDALLPEGDQYFSFDGSFAQGVINGQWQFRFGEFYPEKGTELNDYQVKVTLRGTEHVATVHFQDGKPEGDWMHTVRQIENSAVKDTVFESRIRLEAGVPHGILHLENDRLILLGRFLKNGLAHDIWELNFNEEPEKIEQWFFADGRLEKILIQNDQEQDSLMVYASEIQDSKTIHLDEDYFKILLLQGRYDSTRYSEIGGEVSNLISENAIYDQRVDRLLLHLERLAEPVPLPKFGVKVAYFPLDKKESKQLRAIESNLQKIDTISQSFLENTRLNLLKHADEDILFWLATLKEINQNYLSAARTVVAYQRADLLDFFPRENLPLPSNLNQKPAREIKVNYEDSVGVKTQTFVGPEFEGSEEHRSEFAYLVDLSSYALLCIDSLAGKLQEKLGNQKFQRALEDFEKPLIKQADRLTDLLDSLEEQLAQPYQTILKKLYATADSELRQYSEEEDLATRPQQARALTQCLEEMEKLVMVISKLPARWEEIQKSYTEQVWNPFTATIMKDQVKERITQAYDQVLIPATLDSIKTTLNCTNTLRFRERLDALYTRMQELRTTDTSRLERRLKNEDDPQVVMKLFEIST